MCGINGVVGLNNISEILFQGIRNLEYRGYDSCGIALMNKSDLVVRKNTGRTEDFFRNENIAVFEKFEIENISKAAYLFFNWGKKKKIADLFFPNEKNRRS